MKIQLYVPDQPYMVEIHRTDEALFLRTLPWSRKRLWRKLRYLGGLLLLVLLGMLAFVAIMIPYDKMIEAFIVFPVFGGMLVGLLALMICLENRTQKLIRIDREGIHSTLWLFGKGSTAHMPRRLPLNLIYNPPEKAWKFEQPKNAFGVRLGPIGIKAERREIEWIMKELKRFELEVPADPVPEKYKPPKEDPGRSVLDTMEFNGQALQRLPNPFEVYSDRREPFETETPEPGILHLRCPRCDGVVPWEQLWKDRSLAKCPACEHLFPVAELTARPEPRHHRIRITEDDEGLHLVQRPALINMASLCLAIVLLIDLGLYAGYLQLLAMTPELTAEEILAQKHINGSDQAVQHVGRALIGFHLACLIPLAWMWFGRRSVDFYRETVRFRIWFLLERSWTVHRTDVGVFYGTLLGITFFHGFRIPYRTPGGRLRSFWLPATEGEMPWIESRVYRWCLDNPPHREAENFGLDTVPHADPHAERWHGGDLSAADSSSETEPLDTALGGSGEDDFAEVRLYCRSCSTRLSAEEVDVPEDRVRCRSCGAEFPLEKAGCFLLERGRRDAGKDWAEKPELQGLTVREIEEPAPELVVRYRPRWPRGKSRVLGIVGTALGIVFLVGLCFAMVGFYPMMILDKLGPSPGWLALLTVFSFAAVLLLAMSPYVMMFLAFALKLIDEHRASRSAWLIRVDGSRMLVTRRCGKRLESVEIERSRIVEVRRGDGTVSFFTRACGWPVFERFPSILWSRGLVRIELVLDDGRIEYLPQPPMKSPADESRALWLKNRLADFLARK